MLKYNCIVVEDEPLAAEVLTAYIEQVPFLELAGICTDAVYAMELLRNTRIELIFLDIHLPKLKGLDFLESLKNPPHVIVTSAYQEYALQGYELNVIDYLLKPIRFTRFLKAVNKLIEPQKIVMPAIPAMPAGDKEYLFFNVGNKKVKIFIEEILYIESFREYIKIYTKEKMVLTRFQLNEVEAMLSKNNFLRVHRSFIVAKDKISAFSGVEIEINNKDIPIGRNYKELVLAILEGKL